MEVMDRKTYKDFETVFLGESDIAALVLVGITEEDELKSEILNFGGDGIYWGYIVDDETVEIGSHYELKYTFKHWLTIYDDFERVGKFWGKKIEVYRAGGYGCIIRVIKWE